MKVIIIFSFLLTCTLNAQVNLVLNPSFESINNCPTSAGQLSYANNWSTPIEGGGDPDLHNSCAISTCYCGVPIGSNGGYQSPQTGEGFSGVMTWSGWDGREYIQGELMSVLNEGSLYCVTFYVNLRNNSQYYCNSIGAYLDDGSISASSTFGIINISPQVDNIEKELNDTLNWMKIDGSFTSNGTEKYITIGNFLSDALSDSGIFSISNPTSYAYYNIDDVSVIDMSTPAQAGNDTIIHPGESVFIGRQPEIGLNEACIWFVDGVPIDTIAGMWVTPAETTTYVLQQTLCGDIKYDTVTVVVDEFAGVFEFFDISGKFILYPNPNDGNMVLEYVLKEGETGQLEIHDMTGKKIADYRLEPDHTSLLISEYSLTNGVYICTFKINNEVVEAKRMVVLK